MRYELKNESANSKSRKLGNDRYQKWWYFNSKSWDIKKIMDKNKSEKWDVKMWLKWRYGIEKSNCCDGRLIKITKTWYSKDSKIRLQCESAEVTWNPTSRTEIQKELSLRTEIFQYSFNFHSSKLRFENVWICIWCQNLQAKSGTRNKCLLSFLSKHSYRPIQLERTVPESNMTSQKHV